MFRKTIFFLIVILSVQIYSQVLSNKWVLVSDLDDEKVFVDTSTIKYLENQITVLTYSFFKKPKKIETIDEDVYSCKEQIFFTITNQKFSRIGSLYYNDKMKILGEKSTPGLYINSNSFSELIENDKSIKLIYDYCLKYLNKKEQLSIQEIEKIRKEKKLEYLKDIAEGKNPQKPVFENKNLSESKSEKDSTFKIIDNRTLKEKFISNEKTQIIKDDKWESTSKKTIFFDGSKYVFQVSSWKNKLKAEKEMKKLKDKGYDAFVVEANIPERGGKWYRVRVGYFDTPEEAEEAEKKLK